MMSSNILQMIKANLRQQAKNLIKEIRIEKLDMDYCFKMADPYKKSTRVFFQTLNAKRNILRKKRKELKKIELMLKEINKQIKEAKVPDSKYNTYKHIIDSMIEEINKQLETSPNNRVNYNNYKMLLDSTVKTLINYKEN